MSSPPRRSLQTRGSNRPTRNALHPPRGARSTVACRALSGAPAPSRARQPGPPRGPRAAARRVRYAPPVARAGQREGPIVPVPASPPRRPPPPLASPPPDGCRVPRRRRRPRGGPLAHRGPRSTTDILSMCGVHLICACRRGSNATSVHVNFRERSMKQEPVTSPRGQ